MCDRVPWHPPTGTRPTGRQRSLRQYQRYSMAAGSEHWRGRAGTSNYYSDNTHCQLTIGAET
eukprot:7606256-Karenia_brevis.AAC.1